VIDTTIARSYCESTHPTSTHCREFLNAVRDLEFRVVMTDGLLEEWKRHRSKIFRTWLTSMFGRKLVARIKDVENASLRQKIKKYASSETNKREMLKDVLLLEASMATDWRVSSMNDIDRKRFRDICEYIVEIREVVWVNPDIPAEKCLEWLEAGAPDDDFRKLGYVDKS
jgi:hypothetical protein